MLVGIRKGRMVNVGGNRGREMLRQRREGRKPKQAGEHTETGGRQTVRHRQKETEIERRTGRQVVMQADRQTY